MTLMRPCVFCYWYDGGDEKTIRRYCRYFNEDLHDHPQRLASGCVVFCPDLPSFVTVKEEALHE